MVQFKYMQANRGYAGLIMLLVVALIVGVIYWYAPAGKKSNAQTQVEVGQHAIDSAVQVKAMIEQHNAQTSQDQ